MSVHAYSSKSLGHSRAPLRGVAGSTLHQSDDPLHTADPLPLFKGARLYTYLLHCGHRGEPIHDTAFKFC